MVWFGPGVVFLQIRKKVDINLNRYYHVSPFWGFLTKAPVSGKNSGCLLSVGCFSPWKIKWASNRGPFNPIIHSCLSTFSENFMPFLTQINWKPTLLSYLEKNGFNCKRINSQLELDPKFTSVDDPDFKRVIEVLSKSEKKSRPRKLKTLSQHISSIFQKNIAQNDIDRIIDMLFANNMISETNDILSYSF